MRVQKPHVCHVISSLTVEAISMLDLVREPFVHALGSIWASHPATDGQGKFSGGFLISKDYQSVSRPRLKCS
jgi:hypothetical protein